MSSVAILFWIFLFIVFYTFIGYGILLFALVKIKDFFIKKHIYSLPDGLPDVTLFITAYNEEAIVDEKMANCRLLDYPKDKLHIVWVTDGSNDATNEKLSKWDDAVVYFEPERRGKMHAMNRGMKLIDTPFVIFTDANTTLNPEAIREMMYCFGNPKVGCVAGEKRIVSKDKQDAAQGGEGIYWKYESLLKAYDYRLYSTVGAAGELFAIRRELYQEVENDTLLDDFVLSLRIVMKGYKIAYCKEAYAIEGGSASMGDEEKRKVRIAAGGLQSIWRLRSLFNPLKYGIFSFQYLSHRVLRWSITPFLMFALLPLNVALLVQRPTSLLYWVIFILQIIFYVMGCIGNIFQQRQLRVKIFFIPYYFLFMNINVFKGIVYLMNYKGGGTWVKSSRRNI
jgi:cellulose synthase/poly-beta-1,6-N-acetylglucosamine synthase-like glycosyltransferase